MLYGPGPVCGPLMTTALGYADDITFRPVPVSMVNKSVRKIFELPNNTHRLILGPLIQPHISHQLYIRDVKFIYRL